ncbi:VapE domain-containing protein, partial [Bacillus cereus]|uniref:VapE domain-containing protein n=1 Tax=Bacillus cereus TaxID=1396 RepID=UPI003F5825DF
MEGSQGCGKSSFVKLLSPHVEWFSDSPIGNTESKDAPLSLQGRWIIELGEMSVLSKSGVEALKAFVSSSIDHVRRPYGR